jgi:hypothetical protein
MDSIDMAWRRNGAMVALQDLREGKPVYVNHGFKWDGGIVEGGQLWHPGMTYLARLFSLMEDPGHARMLISQQEWKDRQEWARLKPVRETLAPMIEQAGNFARETTAARGQLQAAEQAVIRWRGELEAAEMNLARTERQIQEYISGLHVEIPAGNTPA